MPPLDKSAIRKKQRAKRAALSETTQKEASRAICARIQSLPIYQNAEKVAFYQAVGGEVDPNPLWLDACNQGKTCYMPVMLPQTKTLIFLPTDLNTPQKINQFKVLEPDVPHEQAIALERIDLMLMPLVAFEPNGTRLGQGAGYYDRTLNQEKPAFLLGVAYEFQREPALENDPWDVPLHGIITEKNIYWSNL